MVAMWESRTPPDHLGGAWPVHHGSGSCRFGTRQRCRRSARRDLAWLQGQAIAQRAQVACDREDPVAPPRHPEPALGELRLIVILEPRPDRLVSRDQRTPGTDIGLVDPADLGRARLVALCL